MMKSLFLLDRSAKKSITRIIVTRYGRCLGGVYSVKTWLSDAELILAKGISRSLLCVHWLGAAVFIKKCLDCLEKMR